MTKAIKTPMTQRQIVSAIAEDAGLSQPAVTRVLVALACLADAHLIKRGSGVFVPPYLGIKLERSIKPARKKRQGRNPATGETIEIAAKPKQAVVKVKLLKRLKDLLGS